MMYGFGDDQNPYTESVDFLEDLVIEFITEMTHRYIFLVMVALLTRHFHAHLYFPPLIKRKYDSCNFF